MIIPLIPPAEGSNFQAGVPEGNETEVWISPDERAHCKVLDRDYSGKDPDIQFPQGKWHINAGSAGGAHGSYHQAQGLGFRPELCKVTDYNGKKMLRLESGHGVGTVLSYFFDPIYWTDRQGVEVQFKFLLSNESLIPIYQNFEWRGVLNFLARKNESVECYGMHLTYNGIMVAYYRDAVSGDGLERRIQPRFVLPIERDRFYTLTLGLQPTDLTDEWQAFARLRRSATPGSRAKMVWHTETIPGLHPNNISALTHLAFGDERKSDNAGGVFYYKVIKAWKYELKEPVEASH